MQLARSRSEYETSTRAERGLRPELVPGVEVGEVLPDVSDPPVGELKDDAVANFQALAVPLRDGALDADRAVLVICGQVAQFGPEVAACLLPQPAEVAQRCVAPLVVTGQRAAAPRVSQ